MTPRNFNLFLYISGNELFLLLILFVLYLANVYYYIRLNYLKNKSAFNCFFPVQESVFIFLIPLYGYICRMKYADDLDDFFKSVETTQSFKNSPDNLLNIEIFFIITVQLGLLGTIIPFGYLVNHYSIALLMLKIGTLILFSYRILSGAQLLIKVNRIIAEVEQREKQERQFSFGNQDFLS